VSSSPVAWTAIGPNAAVLDAAGTEIARVVHVAGDENEDIFNGLVVTRAGSERRSYIPAERVTTIWPDRVETDLGPDEAAHLADWTEPPTTTVWHADDDTSFGARMRRAWNTLIGRRS
jgi:hypothetical protein